jgi:hypothetical protein
MLVVPLCFRFKSVGLVSVEEVCCFGCFLDFGVVFLCANASVGFGGAGRCRVSCGFC